VGEREDLAVIPLPSTMRTCGFIDIKDIHGQLWRPGPGPLKPHRHEDLELHDEYVRGEIQAWLEKEAEALAEEVRSQVQASVEAAKPDMKVEDVNLPTKVELKRVTRAQ